MKRKAGKKSDRSRSVRRPPTKAPRRSGQPRPAATGSRVLDHLAAEQGLAALRALADRRPELVPEMEQIVSELAASTTAEAVADRVIAALADLTMFDLALGEHLKTSQSGSLQNQPVEGRGRVFCNGSAG